MNKEINTVADAVPVIMEARGYVLETTGCTKCPIPCRRPTWRGEENCLEANNTERIQAECCSLDVLAKEVWAKFPHYHQYITYDYEFCFDIDFEDNDSPSAFVDMKAEKLTVFEAACIATARALIALKEKGA